ncbi:MAG: tetratricopeptide repeat protein [Nevskia sp.]|nr:tetratricopeptide repeat protein [Nevskia sp.]
MFDSTFAWLLLPLGIALGWAWARGRGNAGGEARTDTLAGLSSLANDNADQAIVALSRAAEADPAAAELQLTLGGLFRKRGEIDRAIQLHEAVLARPGLPQGLAEAARVELAQDFLKAGLLDRAESLLRELADSSARLDAALELMLDLYEQGRDWPQAIEAAQRLQAAKGRSMAQRIAHYRCELADAARQAGDIPAAAQELQRALEQDSDSVRACLAQAALAEQAKDWPAAIKAYWNAMQRDGRFFSEVVGPLERCYRETADPRGYGRFLDEAETALADAAAPSLAKARWLREQGGDVRAYFGEQLARKPTREGVLLWLETGAGEDSPAWLQTLRESLRKSLQSRPRYACSSCGLQPSMLFWQCPKCRHWGTVFPLEDRL